MLFVFLYKMCLNYIFHSKVSSIESQGFLLRLVLGWLLIPLLRPKLINMREMEKYLETECSDINYTVVRPPGLTNGKASGNAYIYSCKHLEALLKVFPFVERPRNQVWKRFLFPEKQPFENASRWCSQVHDRLPFKVGIIQKMRRCWTSITSSLLWPLLPPPINNVKLFLFLVKE